MVELRTLSEAELLDAWDRARTRSPLDGIVTLLAAACPGVEPGAIADLSVGDRDAALAALRMRLFGAECDGVVRCGACGERLEVRVPLEQLFASSHPRGTTSQEIRLAADRVSFVFRVPTTRDLQSLDPAAPRDLRDQLLARCLVSVVEDGTEVAPATVPPALGEVAVAAMAEADPCADVSLALTCPVCNSRSDALFDITAFLWRELEEWSDRLLRDVHVLASAYGWSEADILRLPQSRRAQYLRLVNG